jgi:HlyD family secretion protein
MKKKTWIIIAAVLVVIVGGVLYFRAQAAKAQTISVYQTEEIKKDTLTAVVGATGSVRANQSAEINWQTNGTVLDVKAKLDDKVKAGDVLSSLDPTSLSTGIINSEADLVSAQQALQDLKQSKVKAAQAELDLINAKDDYKDALNERALLDHPIKTTTWKMGSYGPRQVKTERDATQKEIDEANAKLAVAEAKLADAQREYDRLKDGPDPKDLAAAEARVNAAQASLNMARLVAPFSGTITDVNVKPGDIVNAGTLAYRLDDLSHLLVDVDVSEVDINQVKVGQKATLTFDSISGAEYEGKVTEVARVGTSTNGVVNFTVTVEITNPDGQVLPQMTSAVNIVTTELTDQILIPNRAVRQVDTKRVVFIQKNGIPTMTEVKVGSTNGTYSVLLEGEVKPGDTVIMNPSTQLIAMNGGGGGGGIMMGGR